MFSKNHITPVFILFLSVTVVLLLLSFLPSNLSIMGIELKEVNLLSELMPVEEDSLISGYVMQSDKEEKEPVNLDELLNALTIPIEDFGANSKEGLTKFYDALKNHKEGDKIRIAYFGDSIIEGDLFSQELRNYFQKKFGGTGVGFMPITNNNSGIRSSISINYSEDFLTYSILKKKPNKYYFGINGNVVLTDTASTIDSLSTIDKKYWVEYNSNKLSTARLFYSSFSDSAYCSYTINGQSIRLNLPKTNFINEIRVDNINGPTIRFDFSKHLALYGVSFENGQGVFVDNFSLRGHSGLQLIRIPQSVLSYFNSNFKYNLIILQYGANVLTEDIKDYSWYQAGMVKVINHLKSAFPDAAILLVGANDRSKKDLNGFTTIKSLNNLVESQRDAARTTKIGFWNLFKAMGGKNSMPLWVDKKLASSDYTHFNFAGARILSKKLMSSLLQKF